MTAHNTGNARVWLGLDLGTQSARVAAVSDRGDVLAQGSYPISSRRNGSRHEQSPEDWWRAIVYACRAALAAVPPSSVQGLALCATSGTILLVDESGNALTPAIMYDDVRAIAETQRANEAGAAVWASLGYRMQPSWALPKLLWLVHQHPDVISGAQLAHQTDFINHRFAGCRLATDSANALKTGYDPVRESWPHDVLDVLGVPQHLMPEVVRFGTQIGRVCAEAAAQTGIPADTPIFAGTTDGCAAQIAAGALQVGSWNSVLGTTLVLKGVSSQLIRDPAGVVYCHRSPDGNWLPGGASSTGAAILAKRFPGRDLDALSAEAAQREPASVVAYPLASRGERFPFVAPQAEGFVLGNPRDEADLFAALLQGVSFIERLCFDYLDRLGAPLEGDLTFTGGAARNRYWCQLRADILGRSVRLPEHAEPALGMAVVAASAGGSICDTARQMVRTRHVIDPRADRSPQFVEPYLRLVEELARHGWLDSALLQQAQRRATAAVT